MLTQRDDEIFIKDKTSAKLSSYCHVKELMHHSVGPACQTLLSAAVIRIPKGGNFIWKNGVRPSGGVQSLVQFLLRSTEAVPAAHGGPTFLLSPPC